MDKPICGTYSRLEWLKKELYKHLGNVLNDNEKRELVGWYFSYGFEMRFKKEELIEIIKSDEEIYNISLLLCDEDIMRGRTPPVLRCGDEVEVIVNAKNLTYHIGKIFNLIWHGNEKEWFYIILENGKKVGKRYFERDLRLIKKAEN
jgi:hypothetical protein